MDLNKIRPDLEEILENLNKIRLDLEEIRRDLKEIRPDLDEISPDLNRSDKIILANYFNRRRKLFPVCFPVGSVEIGFPCFNPSTDPPSSDFGIWDPPPTVTGVGSDGSRSESAGLAGWVGYRVWLDTPRDNALIKGDLPTYHTNNLKRFKAYEERSTKVTLLSISHF